MVYLLLIIIACLLTLLIVLAIACFGYYRESQEELDEIIVLSGLLNDYLDKDKALRRWILSQKIRYDDMYEACLNDIEKWLDNYKREEQI